jgi:hypothetical protein
MIRVSNPGRTVTSSPTSFCSATAAAGGATGWGASLSHTTPTGVNRCAKRGGVLADSYGLSVTQKYNCCCNKPTSCPVMNGFALIYIEQSSQSCHANRGQYKQWRHNGVWVSEWRCKRSGYSLWAEITAWTLLIDRLFLIYVTTFLNCLFHVW